MEDTVYNSQLNWVGNDPKPMHSFKQRVLVFEKEISAFQSEVFTLQNENNLMRTFGNNLTKKKTVLKEHNLAVASMIANLNGYIT